MLNSSTEFRPLLLLVAVDDDATPSFDDVEDAEVEDEVMFGVLFILLLFIDGASPSLKIKEFISFNSTKYKLMV